MSDKPKKKNSKWSPPEVKPNKEIKAFVNRETTAKKGETTNKRVDYLNVKTKKV